MAWVLSEARFKALGTITPELLDELGLRYPEFVAGKLAAESSKALARLRKRYPALDSTNVPAAVEDWVAAIVTHACYMRLGYDPNNQEVQYIKELSDAAKAELIEAANGETGLLELTANDSSDTSTATKGGPFGYSEQSPYTWTDLQFEAALDE